MVESQKIVRPTVMGYVCQPVRPRAEILARSAPANAFEVPRFMIAQEAGRSF
jgi:hypothetical protein